MMWPIVINAPIRALMPFEKNEFIGYHGFAHNKIKFVRYLAISKMGDNGCVSFVLEDKITGV